MGFSPEAKNYMLDQRLGTGASSGTYAALCNGAPSDFTDAKTKEVTAARVQVNFAAAAAGAKGLGANVVFNVDAGDQFSHVAWWKVAPAATGTAAEYVGSSQLAAAEGVYGSNGTYTLTAQSFTLPDP